MTNTNDPKVTQEMAANAADGLAGIKELALLDNGAGARLEELERFIFYRQFYFPGGEPVIILPGKGTNKAGKYKYDQMEGEPYALDTWDPRYIKDYIVQAQQNGFHRHFLYFDGSDVKTISYDEAAERLMYAIEGNSFRDEDKDVAYGILSGMAYMDKTKTFCEEYATHIGKSQAMLERMMLNGQMYVDRADTQLKRLIGQSKTKFIKDDRGWFSQDIKYAFDVKQYAAEWESKQKEYKEYKNKIWEILKNTKNLNLCTNHSSGINVGNVNIQQQMDCMMKIEQTVAVEGTSPTQPTETQSAQPATQQPTATPVTQQEQQPEVVVPNPNTPVSQPETSSSSISNSQTSTTPQQTPSSSPSQTSSSKQSSTSSSPNYTMIIIIVLIIFGVIGGVSYMMIKKNMDMLNSIESSRM